MSNIFWILKSTIKTGQLDALNSLITEMIDATKANEPGAIHYEWYLLADGSECHIYERYSNSAAVLNHLEIFSTQYYRRLMEFVDIKGMDIYGDLDEAANKALSRLSKTFLTPIGGFNR